MMKLLAAGLGLLALAATKPATAADMKPVYKAPVVEVWTWDRFYIGLNGGYSWGRSRTDGTFYNATTGALLVPTATQTLNLNGGIFGGQIGKNWQSGNTVFGLEADAQWSGEKGSTIFVCTTPPTGGACNPLTSGPGFGVSPTATFNQRISWFATFRGRLGATLSPTVLAYITGGFAVAGIKTDGAISGFTIQQLATSAAFSHDTTRGGWVVGAGLEGRLSGNWTGKIEALYMDFGTFGGTAVLATSNPPLRFDYTSRVTDVVVRVGVNYQFGGAVVAAY